MEEEGILQRKEDKEKGDIKEGRKSGERKGEVGEEGNKEDGKGI